ncbi:MAG TPA: non-canonical purine NTP pyrophosphatase [Oligoflexia bacterium]|nr:non-canonical purine NTP pyrophosphatase [Oligoflexia bacterium]HMP48056.1 non-canonical purine NTP pyrophosphatase [Oligoflexia bacterium]
MKFFLGTTNPGKVRDFAAILAASGIELEVCDPVDPDETEPDFLGNAALKAKVYSAHSGGISISDDSGLEVDALGGLPGVFSARYSDCTFNELTKQLIQHNPSGLSRDEIDKRNNRLVLDQLKGVPRESRTARFVVALVVSDQEGNILFSETGKSEGFIVEEPRGQNGFGYDEIFEGIDTFGKTYAEIDPMRKNLRSHRKQVLVKFKDWVRDFASGRESLH